MISFAFLAMSLGSPWIPADGPIISEFMAANDFTLADEDGDFPDWIELHNPGAIDVDLGGWHLTDDEDELDQWQFPALTILPAGGFLVVFASDKDRTGAELHTNFKLSASGEYAALVEPDGTTVADEYAPEYPEQYDDISYGNAWDATGPTDQESYFPSATPGAANGDGGPVIRDPSYQPLLPTVDDAIVIEASVFTVPGRGIRNVMLTWRAMYESEQFTTMTDDGMGNDRVADDGTYTATIPPAQTRRGRMIRWMIGAEDDSGARSRAPAFLDPTGSPEYLGVVLDDSRTGDSNLPVLHWFVEHVGDSETRNGTRGSAWFDGRFYDNIFVRTRGGSSAAWAKKSFKLDFNRGHHLVWSQPEWGIGPRTAEEINLNTTYSDKAYVRRNVCFETFRDAGVTGSCAFPIRTQRNGNFLSVATWVEQVDEDFLERHDLDPDGALYKMFNVCDDAYRGVAKKTREHEDNSDLNHLVRKLRTDGKKLETFLFDEVDLPATLNYMATICLLHDNDHVAKNYYLYRDSDGDGEWRFLPWDKDLTLGRNYTISGGVLNDTIWADDDPFSHPLFADEQHPKNDGPWNRFIDACHRTPAVQEMYLRRLRTLMDDLLQTPATPRGERYFETRLDELFAQMKPDVDLDVLEWGLPPWGPLRLDFQGGLRQLRKDYLDVRRNHLFGTHSAVSGLIPPRQGHPHLAFGTIETDPASGNRLEEFLEIRNGTASAVDVSGWRVVGGIVFTIPAGTVIPAGRSLYLSPDLPSFRARISFPKGGKRLLVVGPYGGDLDAGESFELRDADDEVVTRTNGAWMTVRNLLSGDDALFSVVGTAPGAWVAMLASVTGTGPIDTPYGDLDLSPPLYELGWRQTDDAGAADLSLAIPPGLSGITVWFQSFDADAEVFTNLVERVIE